MDSIPKWIPPSKSLHSDGQPPLGPLNIPFRVLPCCLASLPTSGRQRIPIIFLGFFFPGQAGGCLKIRDIFLRNSGRFGHVLFQGAFLVALKGTQPESRQSKSQTCATSKSHGWSLVQLSPDFIQSNTTWSSPSPVPSEK